MKKFFLWMAIVFTFSQGFSQSGTCAAATALVCAGEYDFTSGTTTGKGDNAGNSSPDVYYTITPGVAQTINVGLCGGNDFDSQLYIYSDCTLTTLIATSDDDCALQAQLSFQSDAISTYVIMIEGSDNPHPTVPLDLGDFEISVWCTAPVSPPPASQGINCNSSASGSNLIFTDELDAIGTWTGNIGTTQTFSGSNSGEWEIISTGGAGSSNTGPNAPSSGTTYMNYEASGSNNGATASAVSEAINLGETITEDVELSFYMHAYGSHMGILNVGIGTSSAGPFTTEFTWDGQYQSSETDAWFKVGVDLTSYLGQTIYIEFSHTGVAGDFHGDMSIDLVEVNACDTVLDVNEERILENMTIFPNPVNDMLRFNAQDDIKSIIIYNLLGQEVLKTQPRVSNTEVNMSNLPTGMYVVKVQVGEQFGSYRIIKE